MVALAESPWVFVAGLAITLVGMKSMLPTFWTMPASFLSGTAAAGGVALINSVANLGGFFGPRIIARAKTESGSFDDAFLIMAAILVTGGALALLVRTRPRRETA